MFNEPVTWTASTFSVSLSLTPPLSPSLSRSPSFSFPTSFAEAKDQREPVSSAAWSLVQHLYRGTSLIQNTNPPRTTIGPKT